MYFNIITYGCGLYGFKYCRSSSPKKPIPIVKETVVIKKDFTFITIDTIHINAHLCRLIYRTTA